MGNALRNADKLEKLSFREPCSIGLIKSVNHAIHNILLLRLLETFYDLEEATFFSLSHSQAVLYIKSD